MAGGWELLCAIVAWLTGVVPRELYRTHGVQVDVLHCDSIWTGDLIWTVIANMCVCEYMGKLQLYHCVASSDVHLAKGGG